MNLLNDLCSLKLAPTFGREVAAQTTGFLLVLVVALAVADGPALRIGLPIAYAGYALVRVALMARRRKV